MTMSSSAGDRFDRLLEAMAKGEAPTVRRKTSADPALGEVTDACSSDTQTPQILREMLRADVNVRPVDAALWLSPEALDRVHGDARFADLLAARVIDGVVPEAANDKPGIGMGFVSVNVRAVGVASID